MRPVLSHGSCADSGDGDCVVGKVNCSHPNKKHVGYYVGIEVFWCAECEIFIEEDIDDNYASIAD